MISHPQADYKVREFLFKVRIYASVNLPSLVQIMVCRLVRGQAIISTNAGILLIEPLGTKFSEILIEIVTFSFKKMQLKMSYGKRRPFCLGLNVLIWLSMILYGVLWIRWRQYLATLQVMISKCIKPLKWCHNERDGVSITGVSIAYSTVCSGANQRKHQSSASLAFARGIHLWPVNSPHKGPATRKMFPFDDVIMWNTWHNLLRLSQTSNAIPGTW